MINVIIPPIIILFIIAVLVVIFAKAARNAKEQEEGSALTHDHKQTHRDAAPTRFRTWKNTIVQTVKRTAHRRSKKVAQHEAQLEEPMHAHQSKKDQNPQQQKQQHKLSRMGELILSYHKGSVDEQENPATQDAQEAFFVKQIEANPKSEEAYQQLGDYYMEMHKYEDARESYKYVLRINPRHKRAQEAMKNLDRVLG